MRGHPFGVSSVDEILRSEGSTALREWPALPLQCVNAEYLI